MEYQGSDTANLIAGGVGLLVFLVIALGFLILSIIIWWKIFSKAGYSGALSLLMLIPLVNFVMLPVLAFGTWPIHQELAHLKQFHAPR